MAHGLLIGILVLAACGGASPDPGLSAWLRVKGGQFTPGSLDLVVGAAEPTVVDVLNSQTTISPGLINKPVSGRLAPGSAAVALGLAGDSGYWILPAEVPDSTSPTQPTFHATLSFARELPMSTFSLLARAISPDGAMGPATTVALEVAALSTPSGPLVVSLSWDAPADLDLHLMDPAGVEIWSGNINSFDRLTADPSADGGTWISGGILDFDSNAGCVIDGRQRENIVWSLPPPPGNYIARVDVFSLCGAPAARWQLSVTLEGGVVAVGGGTALPSAQRQTKGVGSGLSALSFTVPPP